MRSLLTSLALAGLGSIWAQPAGFQAPPIAGKAWDNAKAENGAVVFWRLNSVAGQPQVYVYSSEGRQQFALNVLPQISGAVSVSITDVSRGKSGLLAAGAVASESSGKVVALLLTYSREGRLLRAQALDPSREVRLLEVDDDDSIWTLCDNDTGHYVARYDSTGEELGAMVARSSLPDVSGGLEGDLHDGSASFGLAGPRVWFTAPSVRSLVSVKRDGSGLTSRGISSLQRPTDVSPDARMQLLRAIALAEGRFALQVLWAGERPALALYLSDPATGAWKQDSRGANGRLIGTDAGKLAFIEFDQEVRRIDWR